MGQKISDKNILYRSPASVSVASAPPFADGKKYGKSSQAVFLFPWCCKVERN